MRVSYIVGVFLRLGAGKTFVHDYSLMIQLISTYLQEVLVLQTKQYSPSGMDIISLLACLTSVLVEFNHIPLAKQLFSYSILPVPYDTLTKERDAWFVERRELGKCRNCQVSLVEDLMQYQSYSSNISLVQYLTYLYTQEAWSALVHTLTEVELRDWRLKEEYLYGLQLPASSTYSLIMRLKTEFIVNKDGPVTHALMSKYNLQHATPTITSIGKPLTAMPLELTHPVTSQGRYHTHYITIASDMNDELRHLLYSGAVVSGVSVKVLGLDKTYVHYGNKGEYCVLYVCMY